MFISQAMLAVRDESSVLFRAALGTAALALLTGFAAAPVAAQAFNYPSMQLPSVSVRDYTAAIAGGAGTTMLFQWREEMATDMHWQLDLGMSDPKGPADPLVFVGGGIGRELVRATGDQPLDILLTAGVGAAFGKTNVFRIPVGASVGHTFDLDEGMSITPFVHPRVSFDRCGNCRGDGAGRLRRGRSTASLNFDLGASWQVNPHFAVRASAGFGGSDVAGSDETVAVGLTWTPVALSRR